MSGTGDFLEVLRALGWREILGRCFLGFLIAGVLLAVWKSAEGWLGWRSDVKCAVVALDARTKALAERTERLERIVALSVELESLRVRVADLELEEAGP